MDKDKRTCALVITICIVSLAVWAIAPFLGYTIPRRERDGGSCVLQNYRGHLCHGVLGNRTLCITPQNEYIVEIQVAVALRAWGSNGTQCYQGVKSRVCQFYFGPFEVEDAGPCGEWCDNVNYTRHWNEVPSQELQDCDGLDYNESTDELNCSRSFYYSATSNLCKPTCGVDTGDNEGFIKVFSEIGIVACVLTIVAAYFKRDIMFRFPLLLLVYWYIVALIFHAAILVQCCTHDDFFQSIEKPSVCSIIRGLVIFVTQLMTFLLALFHTIILFWNVWFPIDAKRTLELYRNRIHCGAVIFSVTIPLTAAGIITIFSYNEDITFYILVPFCGLIGIFVTLIALVTCKLIIRNKKQFRATCSIEWSPEAKLAGLTMFIVIFFVTGITGYVMNSYRTHEYLYVYFLCESTGTRSCQLQVNTFAYANNAFLLFRNVLVGLTPCMLLLYINPVGMITKYFTTALKTRKNTKDIPV